MISVKAKTLEISAKAFLMRCSSYNTGRSAPTQLCLASGDCSGDKSMEHRNDNPKNGDSAASTVQSGIAKPVKYELPIDFDDILTVAMFDSVLRVKRRRLRNRGAARRPKL